MEAIYRGEVAAGETRAGSSNPMPPADSAWKNWKWEAISGGEEATVPAGRASVRSKAWRISRRKSSTKAEMMSF